MNNIGFPCYVPRIPKSKANTYVPYIFTHEQVLSIFTVCDSLVASDHGNMDSRLFSIPAILRLLYGTGMRVSEATSLLNQDINLEKRVITIRKTKNQRQTPDTCLSVIAPDVKPICGSEEQAAFTPCKCHGVSIFYFSIRIASEPEQGLCVVQNYIKKNAVFRIVLKKDPRVHDLRHTFAVHSLMHQVRNGADIYCTLPILSVFLGHKKLSDTETYVRLTQEMYPDVLKLESSITSFFIPRFTQ